MKLSTNQICVFAECTVSSDIFTRGENLLNSNHVLVCGKQPPPYLSSSDNLKIVACCLQNSTQNSTHCVLKGEMDVNGSIITFQCSCENGMESTAKCHHIIAVLLYLNRSDLNKLPVLTMSDLEYIENKQLETTLQQNKAIKIEDHKCFRKLYKNCSITLSENQISRLKKIISFDTKGETA